MQADAGRDVAGEVRGPCRASTPTRRQAQERIERCRASSRSSQHAGQHVETAAGVHLLGRDARTSPMKCVAAYTSDISTMAARRAGLARDRRHASRRAGKSLRSARRRGRWPSPISDEPAQSPASGANAGFSSRMSSSDHRREHRQHEHRAEHEGLRRARAQKSRRRQAVAEARAVRDLQPSRDEEEAHEQREHRDAARDAVEFEIEAERLRELPGGIREQRRCRRAPARSGRGRSRNCASTCVASVYAPDATRAVVAVTRVFSSSSRPSLADEMQRADHDQVVLVVLEQRLDLRQPLAVARA